jgi:hypothetical protein
MSSPSSSFDRQRHLALTKALSQLRHELASPLSGLALHLEMAGRRIGKLKEGETDQLLQNVRMGQEGVAQLSAILELLGEIARGGDDEPRELSLRSAVRRGAERHASAAHRLGVRLQVEEGGEDASLLGCAERLEQAFADMTSYGLSHCARDGLVVWGFEKTGSEGVARLSWSGDLPPGTAARLFSLAGNGKGGDAEGSLFLARWAVESHGGCVAVESPAAGEIRLAARFTIASGVP